MKHLKLANLAVTTACLAAMAVPMVVTAQAVKHDKMDIRAARADLRRLEKDRKRAVHFKNWSKVAQDDRLMASDRFWIRRDEHKLGHAR